MSLATFAPSLCFQLELAVAALWSATQTSLDYKGRHAGSEAQSTAGCQHGNICREWSSCVTSHHRTHLPPPEPLDQWEAGLPSGNCDWPRPVVSGRFWWPVSAEEGKEQQRRRLRSSGIHSQHDEGLTDPQLHSENEREGEGRGKLWLPNTNSVLLFSNATFTRSGEISYSIQPTGFTHWWWIGVAQLR